MSARRAASRLAHVARLSSHLFKRTVGARYRKSFLGYFWMLAPPLLVSGVASLAVSAGALNSGSTGLPHFLFTLIGVVIWMTFAEAFEAPYQSIEEARPYLTRINFPREAVVLARLYENIVSASVRAALLIVLLVVFGAGSFIGALGSLLGITTALLLGAGVGALMAPFMVLFSDLRDVMRLVIAYGIFISPAMYQPRDGLFGAIVSANPLSPVMGLSRQAASGAPLDSLPTYAVVLAAATVLGVAGIAVFRISSAIIVERMLLGGR